MIKHSGRYYMFGSHLTGWDPNDNVSPPFVSPLLHHRPPTHPVFHKQVYSSSTTLASSWSAWTTFADPSSNTYASQTHYILSHPATNLLMYMGGRWVSSNLVASTYIWLPLTNDGTKATVKNRPSGWLPNLSTCTWSAAPAATIYTFTFTSSSSSSSSGNFKLSGAARSVSCSKCTSGTAAGYLGGPAASDNGQLIISKMRYNDDDGGVSAATTVQVR